ncbi:MAG: class I SAM-dependent methyltransferase [Planctomycetes bacterium]|nr:class I SAM-dependent methyltransferase [Planctomycetota bacterium]
MNRWSPALEAIVSDLGKNPAAATSTPWPDDCREDRDPSDLLIVETKSWTGIDTLLRLRDHRSFLERKVAPAGYLLIHGQGEPALAGWAGVRNALWPAFHVVAVYRLDGASPPLRYALNSPPTRLVRGAGSSQDTGVVLVAIHYEDALQPDAVVKKFDLNAPGWNGTPDAPSYGHFRWMRRIVAECARPAPGKRILDAGCGAGWVGIEAALKGAEVSSFDPSPEMVRLAGENALTQGVTLELDIGFTESPPFRKSFDIVISAGVISFSPDHERFLNGLDSVLEPGGTLVIADLNPHSLGMRYRRWKNPLLPLRELNSLARSQVKDKLLQRGYRVNGLWHYQLSLPVPQLMHLSETRLGGAGSSLLLWLNVCAHRLDRAFGSCGGLFFDSYILRACKPG